MLNYLHMKKKKNKKTIQFDGVTPHVGWDDNQTPPPDDYSPSQLIDFLKDKLILGIKFVFRF